MEQPSRTMRRSKAPPKRIVRDDEFDSDSLSEDDGVFNSGRFDDSDSDGQVAQDSDVESVTGSFSENDSDTSENDSGASKNDSGGSEDDSGASDDDSGGSEDGKADDQVGSKGKKRGQMSRTRSQRKRSRFLETEATAGEHTEDEEEDEDEDEEEDGFVDNEIEDRDKEFSDAFKKRLDAHAQRRALQEQEFEGLAPDEIESRLKKRYGKDYARFEEDEHEQYQTGLGPDVEAISALILPKATDPKLWLVKCRAGSERVAALALFKAYSQTETDPLVYSAIARDSLKGLIYIEAHRAADVIAAVRSAKLNHLIFASPVNKPFAIPTNEMVDVISPSMLHGSSDGRRAEQERAFASLSIDEFVRIKRGKYAGDLAQIVDIDDASATENPMSGVVQVRIVPRLGLDDTAAMSLDASGRASRELFDPQTASQFGAVTKARGFWIFNSESFKDGLLYKDVRFAALVTGSEAVSPTREELEPFGLSEAKIQEIIGDLSSLSILQSNKLNKGEAVTVLKGSEFQNLHGIIESISSTSSSASTSNATHAMVRLQDTALFADPVSIPIKFLRRRLIIGEAVKVIDSHRGEHRGKSGMLVALNSEEDSATVFSQADMQQFTIPTRLLVGAVTANPTLSTQSSRMAESKSAIASSRSNGRSVEVYSLVRLQDEGIVALVLSIGSDHASANVLLVDGTERKIPLSKLTVVDEDQSMNRRFESAGVFRSNDRVDALIPDAHTNQLSLRPATIIHVHHPVVFIRTVDDAQVMVCPITSVQRPTQQIAAALFEKSANSQDQMMTIPRHYLGKSVTISGAGPYKGYVGVVRQINGSTARVELHTNCKMVSVSAERILSAHDASRDVHAPSTTLAWGMDSKTPAWGTESKTPAWNTGSKTPAWNTGSKTPSWNAGSKTPAWSSGSKTPAWSSGSKTPAWSSGSKTPAWSAGGGKTPAWSAGGGKTPAWDSNTKDLSWDSNTKDLSWDSNTKDLSWDSNPKTMGWDTHQSPQQTFQPVAHHDNAPSSYRDDRTANETDQQQQPSMESTAPIAGKKSQHWLIDGALVSLHDGSVKSISQVLSNGRLKLQDQDDTEVSINEVKPVEPGKKDRVKVITEDQVFTGTVIGIDREDAVVRADGTSEFTIVPRASLVKISSES